MSSTRFLYIMVCYIQLELRFMSLNLLFSDYMGFMKKALVLLKSYTLIKRIELEVEEVKDTAGTQSVPAISKF